MGLGNPGARHAAQRHNVGFMAVRAFSAGHGSPAPEARFDGLFSVCAVGSARVGLLAPVTFMNRSGGSVRRAIEAHPGLETAHVLVVHDDLDLPLGRIRLRGAGGAGGQRGLADVLDTLGTRDVPRLRIGVGRPPDGVAARDWVLSDFAEDELRPLRDVIARACSAMKDWVVLGLDRAMESANRDPGEASSTEGG